MLDSLLQEFTADSDLWLVKILSTTDIWLGKISSTCLIHQAAIVWFTSARVYCRFIHMIGQNLINFRHLIGQNLINFRHLIGQNLFNFRHLIGQNFINLSDTPSSYCLIHFCKSLRQIWVPIFYSKKLLYQWKSSVTI